MEESLDNTFEEYKETRRAGLIARFFITTSHVLGLLMGGVLDFVRRKKEQGEGRQFEILVLRFFLVLIWPFLNKKIVNQPFPVQFRMRLEKLGPTYIKLGQILSLREDIFPAEITLELKKLLDRLPAVSFERFQDMITSSIKRPLNTMYRWIDPVPLGSASLAQTHRARLITNEKVVIKVLKPGVRDMIERDTKLLRFFARVLQIFFGRYQPARVIDEFSAYTLREVDLRFEADNAETFAAYFRNEPDIRFPKIYRQNSNRDILCMEYFKGIQPDANASSQLTREQKMTAIDQGIRAIIEMIYRDGFFHADLHPANLLIFKNHTVGFIDLGMVGKFDRDMRKRMFYYFFSLVMGDPDSAARYLTSLALPGKGADMEGFRRAASDLYARWLRKPTFTEFSLGQVILESVLLAGHYRIIYPAEIILMVKALVTIEGVGNMLEPGINVVAVARKHVQGILIQEFNPLRIVKESLLVFPEMVDLVSKSPLILTEGLKYLESTIKKPPSGALNGIRATLLAGFFLLSGAIMVAFSAPWWLWVPFFIIGFLVALRA